MMGRTGERKELAAQFAELLRTRAACYFAELGSAPVQVRLSRLDPRPAGTHFLFTLQSAGVLRRVLVKVRSPTRTHGEEPAADRPQTQTPLDAATVAEMEFRALAAIHNRFDRVDELRFGTVRALDTLPEHNAVVMEFVSQPSLRDLFVRSSYLRSTRRVERLEEAFHNTGAWLRHFHTAPRAADATDRRPLRTDFIGFIEELSAYLAEHLREDGRFWRRVEAAASSRAEKFLPEALPLGGGHGDFAMRNLLVGPAGRVTAVDTHGSWCMPIYEDIGSFLHSLRCNRFQVVTLGAAIPAARLAQYERAFLAGYFGEEPIPYTAVRLFEVQAALEKWSSLVAYRARSVGRVTYLVRSGKLGLLSPILRETVKGKLLMRATTPIEPVPALKFP